MYKGVLSSCEKHDQICCFSKNVPALDFEATDMKKTKEMLCLVCQAESCKPLQNCP